MLFSSRDRQQTAQEAQENSLGNLVPSTPLAEVAANKKTLDVKLLTLAHLLAR
jgi:hypothetical protein